jgi:hypothetical protein
MEVVGGRGPRETNWIEPTEVSIQILSFQFRGKKGFFSRPGESGLLRAIGD